MSEALDFSVFSSSFSRATSSLNVGLRGSRKRPGVPGAFSVPLGLLSALLSGSNLGVSGTSTLVCLIWLEDM